MNSLEEQIKYELGRVNFNFAEKKAYLDQKLEEYRGMVFGDQSIKAAKSCVAELRKEQAELKSSITKVKKEFMKPFDEFKKMADELVIIYDEPINFINDQISGYEERRRAEKKEQIRDIYQENIGDIAQYLPLERIYNPKWENATYKVTDIKRDIQEVVWSTKEAIKMIKSMESESVDKALELYKRDLDLPGAISYINNYERQKEEILIREQERRKQEEIEKARAEEREKITAKANQDEMIAKIKEEAREELFQELSVGFESDIKHYVYRLSLGTKSKKALETYLDSVGIGWEAIG